MNVKFLNPFIQAAVEVLKTEVDADAIRGEISLHKSSLTSDDVTILINLIGAVDGTVFYGMSKETAIQFASALMGEKFDMLNELAQSGIAELGNVITGQASMRLAEAGFESNISTPSLIIGRGASISTLEYPRLVVPLTTNIGSLTIHLSLRETPHANLKTSQIGISTIFESPKSG